MQCIGQKRASGTKPITESGHYSDPSHLESKDDVTCTLETSVLPDSKRPHIEDTSTADASTTITTTNATKEDKSHNYDPHPHTIQSVVNDEVAVDIFESAEGGQNYDPDVVEMTRSTDEDPGTIPAVATAGSDINIGTCILYYIYTVYECTHVLCYIYATNVFIHIFTLINLTLQTCCTF